MTKDKKTKTPVNINGQDHMLEDMSEVGQRLVNHAADLDRKIANLNFQMEQMQLGREAVMSKLLAEIEAPEEAEVIETKVN